MGVVGEQHSHIASFPFSGDLQPLGEGSPGIVTQPVEGCMQPETVQKDVEQKRVGKKRLIDWGRAGIPFES